ncbi:CAF1-domain-containing protein [Eremomyces bilateralis CBS 781.70]|uniref:CAF1-domain-containing protein n=1 Tax=Eremomyces bilateralis CBS 781.70 TaxID=1392243 RepID=A0A6G1G014_9PEZI|nr:CAF1-domain-containing protein [Eremomyces bilateralis CBS 781.70]KAF1811394.1 CAF1-domain-containing protein [Eremomyces bilateralis CBS 781.70]
MDIDRNTFKGNLLPILERVADSPFVSIDCEMSGVVTKAKGVERQPLQQTLQQRYAEVKEAAEKYTILQIGLTCVTVRESDEVDESGRYIQRDPQYILHPYNFNLNPLLEEKLDIERIFSFQSGAVDFLMRHGFQMDRPFTHGVPYLSRAEARDAKRVAAELLNKSGLEDLQLGPEHVDALGFVAKTRAEIIEWGRIKFNSDLHVFSRHCASNFKGINPELTRFEQRLVHQLVRAEFPDLISMGKSSKVVIRVKDEVKEKQRVASRLAEADRAIKRQTGFRWIVDALSGRSLANLTMDLVSYDPQTGARNDFNQLVFGYQSRLDRVRDRTRTSQPVLVGHNMFTDLVYFYKTFVGPLPDTVEEFAAKIHEHFPLIVDTKYMATHNCSDINPASSLEEIDDSLIGQKKPFVGWANGHDMSDKTPHEAGYDSYVTARIMILLSAKLEAAGKYIDGNTPNPQTSSSPLQSAPSTPTTECGGSALDPTSANFIPGSHCHRNAHAGTEAPFISFTRSHLQLDPHGERPDSAPAAFVPGNVRLGDPAEVVRSHGVVSRPASSGHQGPGKSPSWFARATPFDNFDRLQLHDTSDPTKLLRPSPVEAHAIRQLQEPKQLQGWMPPLESDFWRVYGNKLRVFGTVEKELNLAPEGSA